MSRFNYPYAHSNEPGMLKRKLVDRIVPYEEYAGAARKRGREMMSAMCEVYPEITILVLSGIHQVAKGRLGSDEGLEELANSDYGLLAPFGDGLLEGMSEEATLIDGHESSYAYTLNKRFIEGRREIEEAVNVSAVPELYKERMKVGFGLMLDNRASIRGGFHTESKDFIYNHFTPSEWDNALYFAMLNADRYVWVWNQVNGAVLWETPRFPKTEPNVPEEYARALKAARDARHMTAGRDNRAALEIPVPESATKLPGYSDEETFGPLRDEYQIVADLPKEWRFLQDDESLGIGYYTAANWDDSDWETIRIGEYFQRQGHRFRGIAWYRFWFDLPAELERKQVSLLFGAVGSRGIFVNGRWLGPEKKKGDTIQDFTKVAKFGEKNLVCVWIVTTGAPPAGIYKSVKLAVKK